jgi:hypothetical protein
LKNDPAVVKLLDWHYPFSSIALGVIFYFIGLGVSFALGVESFFLQNWLFAMGCIIVGLNTSMLIWAFKSLGKIIKELRSSFDITEYAFNKIERDFRKSVSASRIAFLPLLIGVGFAAYEYFQVASRNSTIFLPPFPNGSFPLSVYSLVLFSFCSFLGLFTVYVFACFLNFLRKVAKNDIKIEVLQRSRKVDLNKTENLIKKSTISWFIGVSIVMTLLLTFSNVFIAIVLTVLIVAGFCLFFIPQFFFHESICNSKKKLFKIIEEDFRKAKANPPISEECNLQRGILSCIEFEQVNKTGEYPIDTTFLALIFFSAIIPIATTILGVWLTKNPAVFPFVYVGT